ncbi:MAG: AMP-dependent synthetase/ligase [Gammaproteobacteria bacterium]
MTQHNNSNVITAEEAVTLGGLFQERVRRTPDNVAYRHCDPATGNWVDTTWSQMAREVARWQDAMAKEELEPGDRVAVMMRNRREWVMFDQAALALGLVTVPVYADDRGGNVAYIMHDSGAKLLVIGGQEEWERIADVRQEMLSVKRIVCVERLHEKFVDDRLINLDDWLPKEAGPLKKPEGKSNDLASIVYTSGTTGFPKGVMLSHANMLTNAEAGSKLIYVGPEDTLLSFLPLSHTLERTAGYYFPIMVGATVAYARSVAQLAEDLQQIRPTVLISVPRIYERVYAKIMAGLEEKGGLAKKLFEAAVAAGWQNFLHEQGRAGWSPSLLAWPLLKALVAGKITEKLGGRLRVAISGGAPLTPDIARTFLGLGVPIVQGYGLTESSPIIAGNPPDANIPESVGPPVEGVEVKIGENDELLARGPNIMLGYWNNPEATEQVIDKEGWLHTGDKARIDDKGYIYITGRIKEIIVLSNGEKVSPADMEMAIAMDPLIEQVMVLGEQKPFLSALCVLDPERWQEFAREVGVDPDDPASLEDPKVHEAVLARIGEQVKMFPGYAQIRRVFLSLDPWSVDNGLLTPTLKLKRAKVLEKLAEPVAKLYAGH